LCADWRHLGVPRARPILDWALLKTPPPKQSKFPANRAKLRKRKFRSSWRPEKLAFGAFMERIGEPFAPELIAYHRRASGGNFNEKAPRTSWKRLFRNGPTVA
jgi:hypothetical protein